MIKRSARRRYQQAYFHFTEGQPLVEASKWLNGLKDTGFLNARHAFLVDINRASINALDPLAARPLSDADEES